MNKLQQWEGRHPFMAFALWQMANSVVPVIMAVSAFATVALSIYPAA